MLRGQGYDNAGNMSGKYNGCQAKVIEECPSAKFSPCALHSLNLVGTDSAKCCPTVVTFFGSIQSCYVVFSGSPKRWALLKDIVKSSLHAQSGKNEFKSSNDKNISQFVNS